MFVASDCLSCRAGGLQHNHAYGYAAASLIDQIDRALAAPMSHPVHQAVAHGLALTAYRLGCRGQSPLTWTPTHLLGQLRPDMLYEAYYDARLRLSLTARTTAAKIHPALELERWRKTITTTPSLWEGGTILDGTASHAVPGLPFMRDLAALGMAEWGDVTDSNGEPLRLRVLLAKYDAESTGRIQKYVHNMRAHISAHRDADWWPAWRRARDVYVRPGPAPEHHRGYECDVRAWRDAPTDVGGREYQLFWSGTRELTWESRQHLLEHAHPAVIEQLRDVDERPQKEIPATMEQYAKMKHLPSDRRPDARWWHELRQYVLRHGAERALWAPVPAVALERESHPTLYASGDPGSCGKGEVRKGAAGRTVHVHTGTWTHKQIRKRKFTQEPYGRPESEALPEISPVVAPLVRMFSAEVSNVRDVSLMNDPVLRLFARVPELEDGEVPVANLGGVLPLRPREHQQIRDGADLNTQVLTLALKLHARHAFTDAVACDASKQLQSQQPFDCAGEVGPTSYGVWEGVQPAHATESDTWWHRRRRARLGVTNADVVAAARHAVAGGRIGDGATVADGELYAIYTALVRAASRPQASQRRVLVLSDCLSALVAMEQTWRGVGAPYRNRSGGATLEKPSTRSAEALGGLSACGSRRTRG